MRFAWDGIRRQLRWQISALRSSAMPTRVDAPPRYRRAILFYTVAIGGPTLILLILGLQSVRRQQVAIDQLRIANLRLSAEQLAISLIERIDHLASACLSP